jgi:uncharacterized DUF497 family protein
MKFEWNASKNKTNAEKHGIDFETAKAYGLMGTGLRLQLRIL